MNISDIVREKTFSIRDTLGILEKKISEAKSNRDCAEERRKRATTEISRQRELERTAKQGLVAITNKTNEMRQKLEEIEGQRQKIIELFLQSQEEQTAKQGDLRDIRKATELALSNVSKEEKVKQDAEELIFKLQSDQDDSSCLLREKLREALEIYILSQANQLQCAFLSEEQRSKEKREQESFQKARHNDPEIAALWEEGQELLKLMNNAVVPKVKQMLHSSLQLAEDKLKEKHPGASFSIITIPRHSQIEELLYYLNSDGKAVVFLPIPVADWDSIGKGDKNDRISRIMCFIWNMIKELGLKEEDGRFLPKYGRLVYETCLSLEDLATLQGFGVKYENSEILHYKLSALPAEFHEVVDEKN